MCNMDDSEFEFVYHFNNHLNHFRSFLSLLVVNWKTVSFSFYLSVDRTRQREIALSNDSNDLVVNKFKLTVVHVAHPNPNADQSVHVYGVTTGQKPVENQDWAAGLLLAKPWGGAAGVSNDWCIT